MKLFMFLVGCKPKGRYTEQHDVFFGIAKSVKELVPQINAFWPEAKGIIHIDVWREVSVVGDYTVNVVTDELATESQSQLYFINLGGYREREFEEYHYRQLTVADSLEQAVKNAKSNSFYKHFSIKGAPSHVDDKYAIDLDDAYNVNEIVASNKNQQYRLAIAKSNLPLQEDELHIGYLTMNKLLSS